MALLIYLRVEKYRPTALDDIVGNKEAISRLKVIASQGNMPNILISGPPGIGKTTAITCLANALLSPSAISEAFLELNASDERGIDVVRNSIKMFATKKVTLPPGRHKIVLLDEADSMTSGAQQALRRIMEIYAETTRFALICNHSSKIIEPIQSRCAIVRFFPPSAEEIASRLLTVGDLESLRITTDGLESLVDLVGDSGDIRQAIHSLQGAASIGTVIDAATVSLVANKPQPAELSLLLEMVMMMENKKENTAKAVDIVLQLISKGYATTDIISGLFRRVKNHPVPAISEQQLELLKHLGLAHMRALEGHGSKLQLLGLIARLCSDNSSAPKHISLDC